MLLAATAAAPRDPGLLTHGMRGVRWEVPRGTLWPTTGASESVAARVRLGHIDQGYLADCYLMAAVGALAVQRPDVVHRMVQQVGDLIEVRLPGRTITVDRDLPMWKGYPLFAASGTDRVLWPAYLEKAIASTHRTGYAYLDRGGDVRDAFKLLTGTRPRATRAPEPGQYLERVREQLAAGEAVVVGTPRANAQSRRWRAMRQYDVHPEHSYVVTGVTGPAGDRRVRLWNVWGYDHPKPMSERAFADLVDEVVSDSVAYNV